MPAKAHRSFRTPPVSGIIPPASGFAPINATRSARSDSDINRLALRRNSLVSKTVVGASAMHSYYTQSAHGEQEGPWRGSSPAGGSIEFARLGQFLDPALHPLVVRPFPVHVAASGAFPELFVPRRDGWRHSLVDLLLGDGTQAFIARHAAGERAQQPREIEPFHHLGGLPAAVRLAQPVAARHGGVFEQPAVPRQQDALLFGGDPRQFRIARAIPVLGVESEHAQIRRQPSQVNIQHELRFAQRLRAHAQLRRDVERFEYGIHRDTVAISKHAGKVRRLAVDQHQVDFRVRNAETLDRILDGDRREELLLESLILAMGHQVVVQFGVKPKPSTGRRGAHGNPSSRSREMDFICRLAMICLTGGSLRTAPRMEAMARWFQWAWLSKIRFWSLPRSMAMSTVRWAVVTGVMTRFTRERRDKPFRVHTRTHTPQPRQSACWSFARLRLGWRGSPAETRPMASTGQASTHFPQPLHSSAFTSGRKLVVAMGLRRAKRLAASRASQQQPQQLRM